MNQQQNKKYIECLIDQSNILIIDQHDFTGEQLERVLDWMVFKMKKFKKVSNESIFKAIELVYQYLQNTFHLTLKELELLSGCSIYISSKFVDLYPIYIDDLCQEVLQKKYYNKDILQQERKICQSLNYNLCFTTSLQLVHRILMDIKDLIEQIYDKEKVDFLKLKIIDNLFYIEIGQDFRQISQCNKALSCILLTMIEENIESRVAVLLSVNHFKLNINWIERHIQDLRTFIQTNEHLNLFKKIPHHKY